MSPNEITTDQDTAPEIYSYIPVDKFTPLSKTNWFYVGGNYGITVDKDNSWVAVFDAAVYHRDVKHVGSPGALIIQCVSYTHNIYRIRYNPAEGPHNHKISPIDYTFGPITEANLAAIKTYEINQESAPADVFTLGSDKKSITLRTKNLEVSIDESFNIVARVADTQTVVHASAQDSNGNSLAITFVDRAYGRAFALAFKNDQKHPGALERFYGQGQVNVNVGGKDGEYFLNKTGLSMTNFNYDQILYHHDELLPTAYKSSDPARQIPDYYYPMYFSAPWIISSRNRGTDQQVACGFFLNNQSQTYTNTGDTAFGPDVGNAETFYLGAQSGQIDFYAIGGDDLASVDSTVKGLSYLCAQRDSAGKAVSHAALPPKYALGFFQGVYGASGIRREDYDNKKFPSNNNDIFFEDIMEGYKDAKIPLEGFAVDVDVQDTYKVFTINDRFRIGADKDGDSIFKWAHQNGLVTQTNITCFIKDSDGDDYPAYAGIKKNKAYVNNTAADGKDFNNDGFGPSDAYCAQLSYGQSANITAIFPDWIRPKTDQTMSTAEWWGENYHDLFTEGLDFVWQDMTTPSMQTHTRGNKIDDSTYDADGARTDPAIGSNFNWRSYHMQVYLSDPRYGTTPQNPLLQNTFNHVRNQHAYLLCWATYNEGILKNADARNRKRSYIIGRGGQIGSQHFGGMWMGDNQSSWPYLKLMIPMIISMNMSGMSMVGADIGGFAQGDSSVPGFGEGGPETGGFAQADSAGPAPGPGSFPSAELLARFVQAGCLLPWFRDHYDRWIEKDPSTSDDPTKWQPKGHGKQYQELYGDYYKKTIIADTDMTYTEAMGAAVKMRYRWQEVLYTAAWVYATEGRPMIRSLLDLSNLTVDDLDTKPWLNSQFFLGENNEIMPAPIINEGDTDKSVHLPSGADWFGYTPFSDDIKFETYMKGGADEDLMNIHQGTMYVLIRKGSKIPTRYSHDNSVKAISAYTDDDPLVFDIFSRETTGSVGDGVVYLDDGGLKDSGQYAVLKLANADGASPDPKSATYKLYYDYKDKNYDYKGKVYLRMRSVGTVTGVTVNNNPAQSVTATDKFDFFKKQDADLYWLDQNSGSVWVLVHDMPTDDGDSGIKIVITCSDAIDTTKPA